MKKSLIPAPPEKPTPNECCGSGCVPCIYDYYYDAMEKWTQRYGKAYQEQKKEFYSEADHNDKATKPQ
jgi:hypothetical protein